MSDDTRGDQADLVTDSFPARVLRNEGRVAALEQLVKETRAADRQLIEQRSDSLAQELERRANGLESLTASQREADLREHRDALAAYQECTEKALVLYRELYDTAIKLNYEQSHIEITGVKEIHDLHIHKLTLRLEHESGLAREKVSADIAHIDERAKSALDQLAQQVQGWRTTDREARELSTVEINRRLDALNHADEKRQEFQAHAVTRELFAADREAQTQRESVLRDQIIALDRAMLGMTPSIVAEKAHSEMVSRMEAALTAASTTLDTKINVVNDKVSELKSYRDTTSGRGAGYASFVGWGVAALGVITTLILLANFLTAR